jgi:hypothetical protein
LVKQGIRLAQPPAVERLLRRTGQLGPMRIVRFERPQLVSRLREMSRNLDEPRRHFLLRDILLAEDFENSPTAAEVNPNFVANSAALSSACVLASVVAVI